MMDGNEISASATETSEPEIQPAVKAELDSWFGNWFPENQPGNHPIPYLGEAWHHVMAAFEDLKQRLGRKE